MQGDIKKEMGNWQYTKKHEALTGGMFYCRDSAKINGSGSLQTSSWFDSDVLLNRQQKHTAKPLAIILQELNERRKL